MIILLLFCNLWHTVQINTSNHNELLFYLRMKKLVLLMVFHYLNETFFLMFKKTFLIFWYLCSIGEGNGNPLQHSCLENPMDGGAWEATVHGVAKSRTWLSDFTSLHLVYLHPCITVMPWVCAAVFPAVLALSHFVIKVY